MIDFQEADKQIRSIAKIEAGRNSRNMALGWHVAQLKQTEEWTKFGYADEVEYRESVGVTNGVWSRYCRIAGCFPYLELERFVLMSAENAEQLGKLPAELRYDPDWLDNAAKIKAEDFRKLVLIELAEAAGVEVQDMRVKFTLPCFEAQRTVITEGIAVFKAENNLKDDATSLEWIVANTVGRKTFYRFIRDELPRLEAAMRGGDPIVALGMHIVALNELMDSLRSEGD